MAHTSTAALEVGEESMRARMVTYQLQRLAARGVAALLLITKKKEGGTAREGTQEPKSRELRTAASPQTAREGYPINQKSREFRTAASPEDCKKSNTKDSSASSPHHIVIASASPTFGLNSGETASQAILASHNCTPDNDVLPISIGGPLKVTQTECAVSPAADADECTSCDSLPAATSVAENASRTHASSQDDGEPLRDDELEIVLFNVGSMQSDSRIEELPKEASRPRWDLILLNETWRAEKEEIIELASGDIWLGSGGTAGKHGVGILVNHRWAGALDRWRAILERIGLLEITAGALKLSVIVVYMPHCGYKDAEVEAIYTQISDLIARLGKDDAR